MNAAPQSHELLLLSVEAVVTKSLLQGRGVPVYVTCTKCMFIGNA